MRLSTEPDRDETRAIELLHAAFDGGVTFLDTADAYCLNDDDIGHNFKTALGVTHNQHMLVIEAGFTFDKINPIPFQLIENDLRFVRLDLSAPIHQFPHRQILIMPGTIGLPMIESSKVQNRFTQRFARNGAVVNADAANAGGAIDNRHSFAKLGALYRGLLPGWAGTDNCQVILSIHRRICNAAIDETM